MLSAHYRKGMTVVGTLRVWVTVGVARCHPTPTCTPTKLPLFTCRDTTVAYQCRLLGLLDTESTLQPYIIQAVKQTIYCNRLQTTRGSR